MKITSKYLTLFALFVCILKVSAQGIVSLPEVKVLYKEYDNVLKLGFDEEIKNYRLEIEGAKWSESGKGNFIVRPYLNSNRVRIIIYNSADEKLKEQYYSCIELPKPRLRWGSSLEGQSAVAEETKLFVEHRGVYYLEQSFKPTNWTASIGKLTVKGKGHELSDEVCKLIYTQNAKRVVVEISVEYITESNIRGTVTGKFEAVNPYFMPEITSGKIFVIESDSSNYALFDLNYPFSLISQIYQLYYQNYDRFGMPYLTSARLAADSIQTLEEYELGPGSIPLVNSAGHLIIDTNEYGLESFVYMDDYSRFYDRTDISRLVIFENTHIDAVSQQKVTTISHIGLAKKYPNHDKYDVVMIIPFQKIIDESFYMIESKDIAWQRLFTQINNDPNQESKGYLSFYGRSNNELLLKDLPRKLLLGYNSLKDFDSVFQKITYDSIPEVDEDPYSPHFGETIVVNDPETGMQSFVYSTPDTSIIRAYVNSSNLKTFLQYTKRDHSLVPSEVIYAFKGVDADYAFCSLSLERNQNYWDLIKYDLPDHNSVDYRELLWKYALRKEIEKSRAYSLDCLKDVKLLGKEFNLDSMGIPANF